MYCPSNENKDKNKAFDSQDLNIELPIDAGNKGLHELHISWQVEGINYYFEKKIFI
ncbi:MAG: hypothetical protein IPP48_04330 [Chitinophagaceae bacterium]|nr:hypothetical protein [Chitinophagaceae bacterium]